MIGIDTNVLVRYLLQDDPVQSRLASELMESNCNPNSPGLLSIISACELVWVLDSAYGYNRSQISVVLKGILSCPELQIERSDLLWQALADYEKGGAGFSDYLIAHANKANGAEITYTFDKRASRHKLFRLINI